MKRLAGVLVALAAVVRPVLAHTEHSTHEGGGVDVLPPTVFLAGTLVLGTALFLDYRGELGRRLADAGVALGALGVLAGLALLFV